MESSQQPANDSFSYSWLINHNPQAITGDVDPERSSSSGRRSLETSASSACRDFDFDLRAPSPAAALLHADQLFSNGLLLPLHLVSSPPPLHKDGTSSTTAPEHDMLMGRPNKVPLVQRWLRGSKKAWEKYFCLCRCGGGGQGRRPAARKVGPETVNCPESLSTSARTSSASAGVELLYGEMVLDSNVESSIYEAVLHCKKSNIE